jgi:hypothetical protein
MRKPTAGKFEENTVSAHEQAAHTVMIHKLNPHQRGGG